MLTTVDFADGVLGLAWIGSLGSETGICAKPMFIGDKPGYYNAGIVSTVNYGVSRNQFTPWTLSLDYFLKAFACTTMRLVHR